MDWFAALRDWSNLHSGIIALLVLVLPILWAILRFLYAPKYWEKLEDRFTKPANYPALLARYQTDGADSYFRAIRRVLYGANRAYGRKAFSWQAFGTSLTVAVIYPLIAAFLAWLIANAATPGGLTLFRDIDNGFERLWRSAIFGTGMALAVYITANHDKFSRRVVDKLFKTLDNPSTPAGFLPKAAAVFFDLLAFAIAVTGAVAGTVAVAVAFAGAVAFTGAVAIAVAITVAFALAGAGAVAFAGAFAGAVAFAGAFVGAVAGDFAPAAVIVLLYLALPLLNALADFVSVGATRWFLRQIARRRAATWVILAGLLIDIAIATLCLLFLLATLRGLLDLWGWISPATLPLDWRAYMGTLRADPWQGIALYLMLATTLLPTAIHLAAGLGGILTHKSRRLRQVAQTLAAQIANQTTLTEIAAEDLTITVRRATFWGYGIAVLAVALVGAGLAKILIP